MSYLGTAKEDMHDRIRDNQVICQSLLEKEVLTEEDIDSNLQLINGNIITFTPAHKKDPQVQVYFKNLTEESAKALIPVKEKYEAQGGVWDKYKTKETSA